MRSANPRRWRLSPSYLLVALLAALSLAPSAFGAGITLDRTPTPPQAVAPGQGSQELTFTITYLSVADRWNFTITNAQGVQVYATSQAVANAPSPISGKVSWLVPAGAVPGRYTAAVQFYSSTGLESTASVTFDVADQLGTLRLIKFEDLNGNGVRDQGEPTVPSWAFRLVNPQGNQSQATTGADGTVALTAVPAGTWQVQEVLAAPWRAIAPASGQASVVVPANGEGVVTMGNYRPAPLTGTVWIDVNGNGVQDGGEVGSPNTPLTLTGTTGQGATVSLTATSGASGAYVFPDLAPGTYTVAVTTPNGMSLTTAASRPGRIITSGVGNPNNDFGMRPSTAGAVAGGPAPNVGIVKRGPETVKPGQVFTYTITVTNRSSFPARNVVVTDAVPADLTLVAIPRGATIANGVVTWRLGTMAGGAARTVSMRVRLNPTSTVRQVPNTAQVTATGLTPRRSTVTTKVVRPKPVPRRTGAVTG